MLLVDKYLWIEKYRPKKLEDIVMADDIKNLFEKFIQDREIPHLLLVGPPGSGKTTMARILINKLIGKKHNNDVMKLNGSSQTGVDVIRNQVEEFLKTPAFNSDSKTKIVFIDEADYLSVNAQAALRAITETYHAVGRFIFTGNYHHKFIGALVSRCQTFEFKKLPKDYIENFCYDILTKESIEFDKESVNKIITIYYPDIRRIIGTLQSRTNEGKLTINTAEVTSNENLFRSYLSDIVISITTKNGELGNQSIQRMLSMFKNTELDYVSLYQEIFNDENVPIWVKIIINKYSNNHINAMIPAMHLMACVYEIMASGNKLQKLKNK